MVLAVSVCYRRGLQKLLRTGPSFDDHSSPRYMSQILTRPRLHLMSSLSRGIRRKAVLWFQVNLSAHSWPGPCGWPASMRRGLRPVRWTAKAVAMPDGPTRQRFDQGSHRKGTPSPATATRAFTRSRREKSGR